METVVLNLLPPAGNDKKKLSALVFDSYYDPFQGVILYIRIVDGILKNNQKLMFLSKNITFQIHELGIFTTIRMPKSQLKSGEVGYLITGIKNVDTSYLGETITDANAPTNSLLPTIKMSQVTVFAGIYPLGDYKLLAKALKQLKLNDSSLSIKEEYSNALGMGFRVGLLGIFHLQIIKERLKKEFLIDVLITYPNVPYRVYLKNNENVTIVNPATFPNFEMIDHVDEIIIKATIITPQKTINAVMKLLSENRGEFIGIDNHSDLVSLSYRVPLSKIIYSFFNKLKSISHGYASLATTSIGYYRTNVVRLDIYINYVRVDELTSITYKSESESIAQKIVHQLKYTIPKRLYPLPVQVMMEGKVIARVDVPPLRKNAAVSGKNNSISKQQELLRRQNINQRKAASNDIELPQKVFSTMFKIEDEEL